MPLPAQGLQSWETQTPSPAWGRIPGTSLPSSARLLASEGLALDQPDQPPGERQRGGKQASPVCNAPGGSWQHPLRATLYSGKGK